MRQLIPRRPYCVDAIAWQRKSAPAKRSPQNGRQVTAHFLKHMGTGVNHAVYQCGEHICTAQSLFCLNACLDVGKGVNLGVAHGNQLLLRENESERHGHQASSIVLYGERHDDIHERVPEFCLRLRLQLRYVQ